jgi:hypothetical protein
LLIFGLSRKISYQAIQQVTIVSNPTPSWTEEVDQLTDPFWALNYSNSLDCLDTIFPSDEAILEAMTGIE